MDYDKSSKDALEVLLRFGTLMVQAGGTAVRTKSCIEVLAPKLGFEATSMTVSLEHITISAHRGSERLTGMQALGPPAINVLRLVHMEELARSARANSSAAEITEATTHAEGAGFQYSFGQMAVGVALASGAFTFITGGGVPEIIAASIGGGVGHCVRSWLSRHQQNQFGIAAVSAIVASALYVIAAAAGQYFGVHFSHYPAGFIASILFLVPGFPLIAGLFDLLQYQTLAGLSRLAYGALLLLSVTFGLSIVVAVLHIDISRQAPIEMAYPVKVLFRSVASFIAGSAFAMLFNTPPKLLLATGVLSMLANDLRLIFIDIGVHLAPAAFLAALVVGLVALAAERRFNVPPLALTVAPIVIMMPGVYAFETIVLFNGGQMLDALQASASCFFVMGALAMGLAVARFTVRTA